MAKPIRPDDRRDQAAVLYSNEERFAARIARWLAHRERAGERREAELMLRDDLADLLKRGELDEPCAEAAPVQADHPGAARQRWGLLAAMLQRLDIAPRRLAADGAVEEIGRRCATCTTRSLCRAWLATGRRVGNEVFCPNAAELARLKEG